MRVGQLGSCSCSTSRTRGHISPPGPAFSAVGPPWSASVSSNRFRNTPCELPGMCTCRSAFVTERRVIDQAKIEVDLGSPSLMAHHRDALARAVGDPGAFAPGVDRRTLLGHRARPTGGIGVQRPDRRTSGSSRDVGAPPNRRRPSRGRRPRCHKASLSVPLLVRHESVANQVSGRRPSRVAPYPFARLTQRARS